MAHGRPTDDLYLDRYEGWYSVRDEAYYDESELTTGEGGRKLSPQGTPVEWTVEESWFFRLSRYQEPLLRLLCRDHPDFIQPDSRRNEVIRFVEGGLRDLSVSRTSFDWGVQGAGFEGHVMYVWVDALTTYMTGLGYPTMDGDFARYLAGRCPPDRQGHRPVPHGLLAGLPDERRICRFPSRCSAMVSCSIGAVRKCPKSLGNVTDPMDLAEQFGVDQLRYFLMREVSFGQDGSYSPEAIVTRVQCRSGQQFRQSGAAQPLHDRQEL
jgi:methionyl-tRNA synthetase